MLIHSFVRSFVHKKQREGGALEILLSKKIQRQDIQSTSSWHVPPLYQRIHFSCLQQVMTHRLHLRL